MAAMRINVKHLEEHGKDYVFPLSRAWLSANLDDEILRPDPETAEGEVRCSAQLTGKDVYLRGNIQVPLVAECFRCLEDAHILLDTEFSALYTAKGPEFRPDSGEKDLTPEELEREFFSGDEIELDDYIRDQILLEAPLQPLCKEDCQGIAIPEHIRPPADFNDENRQKQGIDPRLAPLLEFSAKAEPSKE
ncbi:MAG: DUF177 domain-containing protein [Myxococcales bacterium]|nr:MAG: DUF177 domain-containing protein [Myxococcales bacterium]